MANQVYPKALDKFLTGDIDYVNDRIICLLIALDLYTPDFNNDEFLSSIPEDAVLSTELLTGKETSGTGVADADDITFTSVPTNGNGYDVKALVMVKDTGLRTTSPLMLFYDTSPDLPVTPTGDDINVTWSDDSNKIFKL